jgi:hypothetical protein
MSIEQVRFAVYIMAVNVLSDQVVIIGQGRVYIIVRRSSELTSNFEPE